MMSFLFKLVSTLFSSSSPLWFDSRLISDLSLVVKKPVGLAPDNVWIVWRRCMLTPALLARLFEEVEWWLELDKLLSVFSCNLTKLWQLKTQQSSSSGESMGVAFNASSLLSSTRALVTNEKSVLSMEGRWGCEMGCCLIWLTGSEAWRCCPLALCWWQRNSRWSRLASILLLLLSWVVVDSVGVSPVSSSASFGSRLRLLSLKRELSVLMTNLLRLVRARPRFGSQP